MKKISFEDIGAVVATFRTKEDVGSGQVVKVTGDGEVGPCGAGERFCGVALTGGGEYAGVQVGGFVTVKADSTVTTGWVKLAADGSGGVKKADAGDGWEYLVVETNSAALTAVLCL